jgi:nucleotide-binding universal stress UspA family protein
MQSNSSTDSGDGPDAETQRFALERLRRLRDEAQIEAEVARIQAPSVRDGLRGFAASQAADVIVIGASRRNDVARMLLGDDVREVLEDPPCAVAVAPIGYSARSGPMTKIGVAYDGSTEREQALGVARDLAEQHHAALSAFEALPPRVYLGNELRAGDEAEDEIEEARQQIARFGDVEPHAEYTDDPVDGLRRYGASVDLLVVGSNRYRPPDRHVRRSTSQRLADRLSSPLLVLSSPSRNGSGRERR